MLLSRLPPFVLRFLRMVPRLLSGGAGLRGSRILWRITRKDLHVTKNLLKYALTVLGLALGTCSTAHALVFRHVPEVDPSIAISALTLLAGSLVVLRVRRKK